MTTQSITQRFNQIIQDLESGKKVERVTVRDFLWWFSAQRRGLIVISMIRFSLESNGLLTEPDFEGAYIDELITFVRKPTAVTPTEEVPERETLDPTYRIGKLASANRKPMSVTPESSVEIAVTLMLANDFSQLPVMNGEREVKGIVSWTSLGSRLALGKKCDSVRECMEPHQEISADTSLFSAIDTIVANQYVLIRNSRSEITGIVTTSDLSIQFLQLGEPFLLIGEIENYVRRMLNGNFSVEELGDSIDPSDSHRSVERVSDLTFGEYRRLLEKPSNWEKLSLAIDRKEFIGRLEEVRRIRNDVMHFDPDGIPETDLEVLRKFVTFLRRLATMQVI